ncbi:Glycerol-3-phosphate/dihydroxyacetone phosphate acyltransferase, partial [Kickxella alabastrina]
FIDPVILLMHAARRVYFLVAAASMRRKFIGFYSRGFRGIPVERQQDLAKPGSGKIKLEDRYASPTLISGINTQFTRELKVGMKIALPKSAGQARVDEILSDTQLRVDKEMKDLAAIEALTHSEGTAYKVIPHVNQDEMFNAVYASLNRGECIGIFPEGGSHDRTEMLPLKAGATIMALGATAANPDLGLKIVPTGLNYFHPSKFRSRAVIDFGQPIDVPMDLVEKYRMGGEAKRQACDELLATVTEGLKQVTLNTPDLETLRLIQAGRRLYKPTQHSLTMAQQVELTRRFIKGYNVYRDLPEVKEIRERIDDYNTQLRYYGIRDHQVDTMQVGRAHAGALFLWRLLWLLIMGLVALPGTVLNIPVFVITGVASKRKARAALAASTVKVRARDVIATWKVLIALGLVPLLYTVYSVLAVVFVRRYASELVALVPALASVVTWRSWSIYLCSWALASFMSYTALVFGEQAIDIVKSVRPLFLTLILGAEHTELLVAQRDELSNDITELVNELGPHIYPEFSKTRRPVVNEQQQQQALGGENRIDHTSVISESADTFHKKMREGEQLIRQRVGPMVKANVDGRVERKDSGSGGKYKFNPPTPRTMDQLDRISPLEFLISPHVANREESEDCSGCGSGVVSVGKPVVDTGSSTPEPPKGLYDYS